MKNKYLVCYVNNIEKKLYIYISVYELQISNYSDIKFVKSFDNFITEQEFKT